MVQRLPPDWNPYTVQAARPVPRIRARGAFLAFSLVVEAIQGLAAVLAGLFGLSALSHTGTDVLSRMDPETLASARKTLLVMAASGAAELVCVAGIWSWKKWGVYALVFVEVIGSLDVIRSHPIATVLDLAFNLAFVFVIVSKWELFE